MKKMTKNTLLSLLTATALGATTAAALTIGTYTAASVNAATTQEAAFRMVDGASIRMAKPLGLRFMAEMEEEVYEDLMQEEAGVSKKMGMFIVPYSYLDEYTNNYHNLATKLDYVFYDSEGSVEDKIYEYTLNGETVYRANGVITDMYLHNYARDFIGIGYIAETVDGKTTYTYAEFDEDDNVRNAAYVAIEAYEDYTDKAPRDVFSQYVWGAHLYDNGMTQNGEVFIYDGTEYASIGAVMENLNWSLSLDKSVVYLKDIGDTYQFNATVKGDDKDVDFNGMHINWTSADKNIVKINDDGKMTALAEGATTVTASFMGQTKSCQVIVSKINFENGAVPTYLTKADSTESLSVVAENATNKVLQIKSTSTGKAPGMKITLDVLAAFFENSDVDYIAFEAKAGASTSNNFRRHTWRSNNGGEYVSVTYEADYAPSDTGAVLGIRSDAYKTFFFSRTDYNHWITEGVTVERFIASGLTVAGDSIYVDNIRSATSADYNSAHYSIDNGGARTNGGNLLMYAPNNSSAWTWGIMKGNTNFDASSYGYTSENVTDGVRAFWFKTFANETATIKFNSGTMYNGVNATGYYAVDIYVPADSDATFTYQTATYPGVTPKKGAWTTIYVNNYSQILKITDTTGSKYLVDNFRSITKEEYESAAYGFEANTSGIRLDGKNYLWYAGADHSANTYSIAFTGPVTSWEFSGEQVKEGDYSVKITQTADQQANLQIRSDSTFYAAMKNGFTFWIYSNADIAASQMCNSYDKAMTSNISVKANEWTQIFVAAEDLKDLSGDTAQSLRIKGTWTTIYIDDIQPLPTANTITLVDGSTTTTQSVYTGYNYTLPAGSAYYTREFLGWYDANGNKVATSGVWGMSEDVTLTARYTDVKAIDFEDGIVPSYLTKTSQTTGLSVVTLNGNKVLKMAGSGTNHGLNVPVGFLAEYFADPNVQYVAFDVKSETTQHTNFRRSTIRTTGETTTGKWGQEPYEADVQANGVHIMGYRPDAFKTFFFTRTDYNNWVSNNKTVEMLISAGNFASGENLYVDNIRPATQAEYNKANYGFETGGVRLDGANLLIYYANAGSTWQFAITSDSVDGLAKPTFSNYGYTNENVTEGNRALMFTKTAGQATLRFNNTTVANFVAIANATGYYAFDLYVGAGSDAVLTYPNIANSVIPGVAPNVGGWMTIYCQNDTNVCVKITDTTGGTYGMDNFRSVTETEFKAAQYGFEAGTVGLRTNLLNDANTHSGAAYVYNKGTDYSKVTASLSIGEGNGAGDVNALSNVRIDHTIVHGGSSSLAFDKGNGYVAFNRHANSQALQNFASGFSFWIYSTVEIDGVNTNNFVNGVNNKFNGGEGIIIPANTWTKVVVTSEDIGNGRFMIMQGNWSGTIYLDDFALELGDAYSVTYDPAGGTMDETTQTVYYGCTYQLKTPKYDREFLGWVDQNGNPFPASGVWTWEEDVVLTATWAESVAHYYKSAAEKEENGVAYNVTFEKSTYTSSGGDGALPKAITATDTEDMSYYRFGGEYGLNDFLAFDFTGNNMPILSFFNNSLTNTIYNHAQDAEVKGWLVTNGIYINTGVPYGGFTGAHASRITLIGPYNISYSYDDNGSSQPLTQVRTSIGSAASPSPAAMSQLNANDQYRVLVGWVENGTNMNLRMVVWNMTTGAKIVDYNQGGVAKADWKGDIALYGHFSRQTVVDAIYPVVNGFNNALATYTPDMLSYKANWEGNSVMLEKSTASGNISYPTSADMSYVAFNGSYGLNDYVVFDFTGDNMPIVSFFNNTITNTIYNNNGTGSTATVKDANVTGWVWANGLYNSNGTVYGELTGAHASRLALIGKQKVIGYDQGTNGFRVNLGSATDVHPLSIRALQDVTDTYRMIIGIGKHASTSKIYVEMAAINMITGAVVYNYKWEVGTAASADGSIILYGQFGKTTVLDSVHGIEEDTTLDALVAKYAKDVDYSDEEAVTLDRYGYSSLNNGTYKVSTTKNNTTTTTIYHSSDDSVCSGSDCTSTSHIDYREKQETYDTYAGAGFNIMLAQDAISTDLSQWANTEKYLDMAQEAGLKVILTDWHIQNASAPLKAGSKGPELSSSTDGYGPWVLASDLNENGTGKTTEIQEYLDLVAAAGLTINKTRFKDQNALDAYLMNEIKHYKDHPAFYGVMLADEPSYHNWYCYGQVYRSLKRIAPEMYVQYNLLPLEQNLSTIKYRYPGLANKSSATNPELETAYKSYVEGFLNSMKTDYIQYDDYPFKSAEEGVLFWKEEKPFVDNTCLRNIQLIAEIAQDRGLSVKVVTQTCLMRSGGSDGPVHIRKISEEDARWLNNYLMGFGVKQINYFTYWTKASNSSSGEWYDDGGTFVNRDGSINEEVYNIMKNIMAENTNFAPTISHFDYSDSHVYGSDNDKNLNNDHIAWSSSLTDSNYSFKWIANVTTSKEYTLVTELFDAERYNYMYMAMNTIDPYYGGTQNITITLSSQVKSFLVFNPQLDEWEEIDGNSYTISLDAGQAIYIMPCAFNA